MHARWTKPPSAAERFPQSDLPRHSVAARTSRPRPPAVRLAFCALALLVAVPLRGAPRPVTIADEMGLRTIVDVRIAPDGTQVAYAVSTPSLEKNEHQVALYVVPTAGGEPQRLADGLRIFNTPLPAPRLRWSPDGALLGVLAIAGDRPQVFAVPLDGSAPRQLSAAPEGAFAFEFSPAGATLAYLTRDSPSAEEARSRTLVLHAGAPDQPARLLVCPLAGGEPRIVTPPAHYVDSFSWSPNGRELAYAAAPRGGFSAQYETRLYAVAATGGEPRVIVDRGGINSRPRFSPDGARIAFISTDTRFDIMAPRGLAVVDARGGAPRRFPLADAWVNDFVWAADSRSLYLQANDGTFGSRQQMFEQPIVRLWVADGRAEQVTTGAAVNFSLSVSADGRKLAYRSVEGRTMGDVFVMDTATAPTSKPRRLTEANPQLRELALGELRAVNWHAPDGMEIWGLLLTPPDWQPGRRLPMLVYLHGGPGGGVTHGLFPQFMHVVGQIDPYPTEAMASAGFAVLFPMPRGGAGYGEAGQRAVVGAWGEADTPDVLAGVDAMVERGIADGQRLGVMGASYGGYLTNWILTRTGRFKAASAAASAAELIDLRLILDGGEVMAHYFGEPWQNRESYTAHSPLTFVERITTPLLIQHGERDPRVPVAGAWKMYRALRALGKTVELDVYPRGGHVMTEPALQHEVMRRNLEWFLRWIPAEPVAGVR